MSYIAGSRRDGEEALEVGAFGEADGVVDGVAGAVDLSQGPARTAPRLRLRLAPAPNVVRGSGVGSSEKLGGRERSEPGRRLLATARGH